MAGTRTAPDATGTATSKHLSVHFIDDSTDTWSESHIIAAASTPAQIEAYLDALQADSGASIYKFSVESVWGTDALADADNAEGDADLLKSRSVFDTLNITLKHTTDPEKKDKIVRIPAPIAANFVADGDFLSDVIDGASAELGAVMTTALVLFPSYTVVWARYSEKTELNQKVRI